MVVFATISTDGNGPQRLFASIAAAGVNKYDSIPSMDYFQVILRRTGNWRHIKVSTMTAGGNRSGRADDIELA